MKIDLKSMSLAETEAWVEEAGLPPYKARQVRRWLFKAWVQSFEEMTDISKDLRESLAEKARIHHLEEAKVETSGDGTRKYLFRLQDGHLIETVLIPERGHFTLCISSQVGCAMNCRFCVTGKQGLKRDLTVAEIIDQVVHVKRALTDPERLTNIVFMGMGEPLANYERVVKAAGNLVAEDGMNFSHRTVTLSTCGLVPEIRKLGRDTKINLAVSLNGADDETRNSLMPVNRVYPLEELISALRDFPLPNRRMITIEYILIRNLNDRDEDALKLVSLLKGLRAKVNLIPLNPHPVLEMETPSPERILHFQDILTRRHLTAIIRKSKGRDISAACGQLSGGAAGCDVRQAACDARSNFPCMK
jgi:23S rRNA (adenine2503-C2)-methyltransferase